MVGSVPTQGATNVPLQTTIVFQFNGALSVNTSDWNTAVVEPRESVRITSVQLCVNPDPCGGSGEPRYVRYVVEHAPGIDVTWLFFAARGSAGQELERPFVLRYTTRPDAGPATVSGVIDDETTAYALPSEARAQLAHLLRLARGSAFGAAGRDLAAADVGAAMASAASSTAPGAPHTRVLLLDDFSVREPDWRVRAATVLDPQSTSFSIESVREGAYWPLAVRFTDATSTEIEAIGFLQGGDGRPAPLQVGPTGVVGLPLTLYAFPLVKASERLASATEQASTVAPDQQLVRITGGYGLRPAGTAYAWTYSFRSLSADRLTAVEVHALGASVREEPLPESVRSMTPIDSVPVDSDRVLERVLDDGGREFLDGFRPHHIQTEVQAGDLHWLPAAEAGRPFWRVTLRTVTTSRTRTMTRDVDMASGLLVSEEAPALPEGRPVVLQNYPNPFSLRTRVPFFLPYPAAVRAEVVDLRGRLLAVLLDAPLPPGWHEVEWVPQGAAAGTYFYRLSIEGEAPITRALLVL